MSHKYVNQIGIKDCGVTCLYNIIKYYKGNISIEKLRRLTKTDDSGTSVYNIVKTSNNLGLKSEAYKCEFDDLYSITLPVIAHIKIENKYDHFVVIDKIVDNTLIIHDPIRGKIRYLIKDFKKEWTKVIITFNKTINLIKEKDDYNIKKIILYLKSNFKLIIYFILLSILTTIFSLINSFYLSNLYTKDNKFKIIFIIFIFSSFFKLIIDYIRNNTILKFEKRFNSNVTNKVYKKILSLPLKYHHSRPVGDILSRINDLSSIKEFISNISFSFVLDFIYMIFIMIIINYISSLLFLLLLVSTLIYIIIYLLFRSKLFELSVINKELNSNVNTYLIESIVGIDTIKNFNIELKKENTFKNKYNNLLKFNIKYSKYLLIFDLIQNFISTITNLIMLYLGILLVNKNILSFSYLIVINSLTIYYFTSIKNIISIDNIFIEAKNSCNRLKDLFYEEDDNIENINLKFNNSIEFNNISFKYNSYRYILNNVHFKIDKGDYVFIEGESGVGKSTIFKILTKQLKVEEGNVKIDNINIEKLGYKDINNNICYVSQDEIIFTDTILNNIKLYKKVRKDEIEKVISITGINKFLKEKNESLNFLLEENGHNVSGGERQRILLARALLQNKKILILDETMNGIDVKSEREIIKKINTEYELTLILISHRKDNIDLFNKVISI